jgi:hypothetical protein
MTPGGMFDMAAFAQRVHAQIRQYEASHPGRRFKIDDTVSRILEHDPTYRPRRRRPAQRARPSLMSPGIAKVVEIAAALDTTVGALLGEGGFLLTREDLGTLQWLVQHLIRVFDLENPTLTDPSHEGSAHPRSRRYTR